jgi:hypothetical protein
MEDGAATASMFGDGDVSSDAAAGNGWLRTGRAVRGGNAALSAATKRLRAGAAA